MSLWRDVTNWDKWIVENFIDISTPTFYHQSTLEIELINSFKNYNIFLLKNLQNINPNCSIATYALARVFGKNISQNFSTLFITLINTFLPRFWVLLTVEKGGVSGWDMDVNICIYRLFNNKVCVIQYLYKIWIKKTYVITRHERKWVAKVILQWKEKVLPLIEW